MKLTRLASSTLFLCVLAVSGMQAQEVVPAAGGEATGDGGSASFVVGQVAYTMGTGTGGSELPGVLQPYEISVISGIEKAQEITLELFVFPNPATDILNLKVSNYDTDHLSFFLYDINGKLLQQDQLTGTNTRIEMSNMASGIYFLKLSDNKKEIKTFKILKN